MNNVPDKKTMRRTYLQRRRELTPAFRQQADAAINAHLLAMPAIRQAVHIGAYLSDGTEPDLTPLLEVCLRAGQKVYVPRCRQTGDAEYEMVEVHDLSSELVVGQYGLKEPKTDLPAVPATLAKTMVWLIPGVAYDLSGHRLGRGKGVYDRLLQHGAGPKIGIFYRIQQDPAVPVCDHDEPLDMVVTESGPEILQINQEN